MTDTLGMGDGSGQPLPHYVFDGGDDELRRLLGFSGLMAGQARDERRPALRSRIRPG